jgi:hypothetical protein
MGVGLLAPFRAVPSLAEVLPILRRRLAGVAAVGLGSFGLLVGWAMFASNLKR